MREATRLIFLLVSLLAQFYVFSALCEHGVVDPSDFMGRSRNRLLTTAAGFDTSIESAERRLGAT